MRAESQAALRRLNAGELQSVNVCSWPEAAVRECPLSRRSWGLSGHAADMVKL